MYILNRREALRYSVTLVGSVLVITNIPTAAEAGFFDGIADAFSSIGSTAVQGINYAAKSAQDLGKTAINAAASVVQSVAPVAGQVASSAVQAAGNVAATTVQTAGTVASSTAQATGSVLTAAAPLMQQLMQQFLPILLAQMQQAGAGGPLQSMPLMYNSTDQPVAMPMQTDRADVPMQLGSSDEQFLRDDPYGYHQKNWETMNDYTQRYSTGTQYRNLAVPQQNFRAFPVRPQGLSTQGFFPSRISFPEQLANILPLASMFLA